MLRLVEKAVAREEGDEGSTLDELAREGARQMLQKALEIATRARAMRST